MINLIKKSIVGQQNGFVLIHSGRCGSKVVTELLSRHPAIKWKGELLAKLFLNSDGRTFESRSTNCTELSAIVATKLKPGWKKWFGFEIMRSQIQMSETEIFYFFKFLKQYGINKCILLERRNYFRVILSYEISMQSGVWHSRDRNLNKKCIRMDPRNVRVGYDKMELLSALRTLENFYKTIDISAKKVGLAVKVIDYESDIMDSPINGCQNILKFLSLPGTVHNTRFERTNPYPIKELLENTTEIREYLKDTKYLNMLND